MTEQRDHDPAPARRPTLKDVAGIAGVSYHTVANVINGHPYVSAETRARVEAAIAELGYRPHRAGRQLRQGRSNLLTLAIPYVAHPFYGGLAHAIVTEAERHGFEVLIHETFGARDRELRVAAGFGSIHADGIVFFPVTISTEEFAQGPGSTPFSLIGERVQAPGVDRVYVENRGSMALATRHLIDRGATRIGYLGHVGQARRPSVESRYDGYLDALATAGLEADDELVFGVPAPSDGVPPLGSYTWATGGAAIARDPDRARRLDGLVCASDLLAYGAMRELRAHGIRVPDDVAVVGWDDLPDSGFIEPSLTTIRPDVDAMAHASVAALVRRIADPTAPTVVRSLGYELVVRHSAP